MNEPTYQDAVVQLQAIAKGYDKQWSSCLSSGNLTAASLWAVKKETIENAVFALQRKMNEMED